MNSAENMDNILARLESLERENARLRARCEIENLAAEYEDYMLSGQTARIFDELWSKENDVRFEYGSAGVYEGRGRVCFYYDKTPTPGRFSAYQLTSPHIEIAQDGETARGVWGIVGAETDAGELGMNPPQTLAESRILSSRDTCGRAYRAEWIWQRMELLLRREGGEWRIYSLHIHELFRCPFDKSWVEWARERQPEDGLRTDALMNPASVPDEEKRPPEFNASFATTRHWQYDIDALPPYSLL